MGAGPISGGAAGLIAAACSTRPWRSHVAPLLSSALPTGVVEKALMILDAVSAARSDGERDAGGELVCFIGPHAPPLEWPSFSSSSIHPSKTRASLTPRIGSRPVRTRLFVIHT